MRDCLSEFPLLLTGDASFWFESGPVTDLTVEGCRFTTPRALVRIESEVFPTEQAPYYHRNLKFLNNTFETEVPIKGGYADGIVFKGNQNRFNLPMKLILTNCGSVEAEGCTVERRTEEKRELKRN